SLRRDRLHPQYGGSPRNHLPARMRCRATTNRAWVWQGSAGELSTLELSANTQNQPALEQQRGFLAARSKQQGGSAQGHLPARRDCGHVHATSAFSNASSPLVSCPGLARLSG